MFRDDRSILRSRLDEACQELGRARDDLRVARADADRARELERQLAYASTTIARAEVHRNTARRLRALLVSTLLVLTVGALALVFSPSLQTRLRGRGKVEWAMTTPRLPICAEAVASVEVQPAAERAFPTPMPPPVRPFDPETHEVEASWTGRVVRAQGTDLAPGTKCVVQVMLNAKRHAVLHARADCAGRTLFDSYGRADQYATKNWRVRPLPAGTRGLHRYRVLMGSHLPGEGEMTVNTFERTVIVWSTAEQSKVEIQVAMDSEPVSGKPIEQPAD